mmetsp:Transcript_44070/g.92692  ORF Transcript_44070/g.92692 Transcript_44070/m.92692 type:complete len:102 (+) Transcript_44070:199-504(+)
MKLFLISALISSAAAFAPAQSGRNSFALRAAGPEAIQAAMEASKKYGPASKEARVLWDIVEEMDASDNRYVGRMIQCNSAQYISVIVAHAERELARDEIQW